MNKNKLELTLSENEEKQTVIYDPKAEYRELVAKLNEIFLVAESTTTVSSHLSFHPLPGSPSGSEKQKRGMRK